MIYPPPHFWQRYIFLGERSFDIHLKLSIFSTTQTRTEKKRQKKKLRLRFSLNIVHSENISPESGIYFFLFTEKCGLKTTRSVALEWLPKRNSWPSERYSLLSYKVSTHIHTRSTLRIFFSNWIRFLIRPFVLMYYSLFMLCARGFCIFPKWYLLYMEKNHWNKAHKNMIYCWKNYRINFDLWPASCVL